MQKDITYNRIKSAMEYIAENYSRQPKIEEIAKHANLSLFHFQRLFKEWAGVSPKKFLQYITLNELKKSVEKAANIFELTDEVGLSSQSRVYDLFVNFEAVTPNEFKTKGQNLDIEYGVHETLFGACLIANTARGICALEFIDNNEKKIVLNFKNKWINANIKNNQSSTGIIVDKIFNNKKDNISILLSGSEFQIKVWEALLKIPYGQLCSYSQIAKEINRPDASRAVANAIGKNSIAYLIPCHRVIRNIGGLGGYRWGEERKLSIIGYEQLNLKMNNK